MFDITTEESVFAAIVAREDYIASQGVQVIKEDEVSSSINLENQEVPQCWDFDRFAHTLR